MGLGSICPELPCCGRGFLSYVAKPCLQALLIPYLVWSSTEPAFGSDLVPPGIHSRNGAGAGQTLSRGSYALLYNPANLIYAKFIEPYVDAGYAQIKYTYLRVDDTGNEYEPVTTAVNVPPITAGLTLRFIPSLSLGAVYQPTSLGSTQETLGVPLELGGNVGVYDVISKVSSNRIGVGAAFRVDHWLTLGAGLVRTTEKTALQIIDPEGDGTPFIDALYGGAWNQFSGGVRSELFDRMIVLGLSYRTAVAKAYQGDAFYSASESEDFESLEGTSYLPAVIGFGLEGRFGFFGAFVDVTLEQWSAGRFVAGRGFLGDPPATDYVDTVNIAAGAKTWFWRKHIFMAGFGIYPSNIGDGLSAEEAAQIGSGLTHRQGKSTSDQQTPGEGDQRAKLTQDGEDLRLSGASFGNLEAIPRTVFSGGYRYKLTGHGYFMLGAYMAQGTRTVPETSDGAGEYSLNILVGTLGLAFGF